MPRGPSLRPRAPQYPTALLLISLLTPPALEPAPADPAAPVDRMMAAAEASLRDGELQLAESRYRSALDEGWILMATLEASEGRLPQARDAFRRASTSVADARRALQYLAMAHMEMGEATEAVSILAPLATRNPRDTVGRRLFAQALALSGQPEQAAQELEEAREAAPDDLELVFALAALYLRVGKAEAAERLFGVLAKERPLPQTFVLIGRTYRDYGRFDRARDMLARALEMDPKVRRAHYHLGMIELRAEGVNALAAAIAEFERERELTPKDPALNLYLGLALVEARRHAEALPALEIAARAIPPQASAFHYLGRCQAALGHPAEAAVSLRRALELAERPRPDETLLRNTHYQLALALRQVGDEASATSHFAAAEAYSASLTRSSRDRLDRYLRDAPEPGDQATPAVLLIDTGALSALAPEERQALRKRVGEALARAHFNLGVMHTQAQRFARAAEQLQRAAEVDPDFPQVHYSLGVARFNAQQFDKATAPLVRAAAAAPADANLRRMLALAWLNSGANDKAAELLRDDPERESDPSLQYAYALALVRANRSAEAEPIFSRLLARHGDTAELNVLLGQAHAQQGDYESAVRSLQRALTLKPDVAEANAALGVIYLKQGKLAEAEEALRAELRARREDPTTQHTLAVVLDLQGKPEEALALLRAALRSKPDFADARYVFGKILLAQGSAEEAAEHLEAAARIAPEDANIRYQLAQAYQRLGRTDAAKEQFEAFQQLKDKRRGGRS